MVKRRAIYLNSFFMNDDTSQNNELDTVKNVWLSNKNYESWSSVEPIMG